MSNYTNRLAQPACFANETTGNKAKLIVVVGNNTKDILQALITAQILEHTTTVIILKSAETAWCNIPSLVSMRNRAKLTAVRTAMPNWYTLTAQTLQPSKQVASLLT